MSDEVVIYSTAGFLSRAIFWFIVGSFLLGINYYWFIHRHGFPLLTWVPWTVGLIVLAAGPFFLCYRSLRHWFHYFFLGLRFAYGKRK